MSFNFGSNGMPSMLPILANINNGASYLQTLPAGQAMPSAAMMTAARPTPYNDAPLEFKTKTAIASASLIDLDERENHLRLLDQNFKQKQSELSIIQNAAERRSEDGANVIDGNDASYTALSKAFNQNDVMFNGLVGMSPQGFMMMPSVMNMLDPAAMMSMQSLSQYNALNSLNASKMQSPTEVTTAAAGTTSAGTDTSPNSTNVPKDPIVYKSCILIPPFKNAPAPTTRERPSGCRTVFVGGLPEKITEDIIREVFERCGEITTLRLSKKNFCHVRFIYEASVDSAIFLSGYRIRINGLTDASNCSRLHVDYAQARDDQYEWECKQRQLQREQRHRERNEQDRLRPLSPPPIIHYTDLEASVVAENLKSDDFTSAIQILITWLERGDCNKKNSNTFYSMIQSTNSHVRRLMNDKPIFDEELRKAQELYAKQMNNLNAQFSQIEKVFGAASHKKVWDHFTKAQRKNIDVWKRQTLDFHTTTSIPQSDDGANTDEMDLSDDTSDDDDFLVPSKRFKSNDKNNQESFNKTIDLTIDHNIPTKSLSTESEADFRSQQLKVLHEAIRNLQTQLLQNKANEKENLAKISALEKQLKQANVKELLLKTRIVDVTKQQNVSLKAEQSDIEISENESDKGSDVIDCTQQLTPTQTASTTASSTSSLSEGISIQCTSSTGATAPAINADEARLIGLVSTFLVVHPFGASLDYVYSYVQRMSPRLRPKELEEILGRYATIFSEEVTGVGAQIERKWKFCGFDTPIKGDSLDMNSAGKQ